MINNLQEHRKDTTNKLVEQPDLSYFNQRLNELGLTTEEAIKNGLSHDKHGNIIQYVRDFKGDVIKYLPQFGNDKRQFDKIANRSTSYNLHEEGFFHELFITRYTPQYLANNPTTGKYKFPSKKFTGVDVLPMPNNKAIEAIRTNKKGGLSFGTEGYFKTVAASVNGLEGVAFSGISTYKLCSILKDYLLKRQLDNFVILYDSDATDTSNSSEEITTKRPKNFFNSAFKFAVGFYQFCKENGLKTSLHFAEINPQQTAKGLDDLFTNVRNGSEVVEAFQTFQTSKYFNFVSLSLDTCHNDLLRHFCLDSPLSFLNKHIDKIRPKGGFRFNNAYLNISEAASAISGGVSLKLYAKEGEKLTDILNKSGLSNIKNSYLIAPTGSGKNFYVAERQKTEKIIIVVPTTALLNMISKEYHATKFDGKNKEYQRIINSNFIVTTYASFGKLSEFLERKNLINSFAAYVDEAHNFTTSTSKSFQLKQLTEVLNYLPKYKYFNLLTGTNLPNFHQNFSVLPKVEIIIPKPTKLLHFVDATDTIKAAEVAIRQSLKVGRFPMVLFNNTSDSGKLGTLKALLKDAEGIEYFDSSQKETSFFKELTENRKINTSVKAIVTTTVLKEGNDILNNYDFDMIICGNFHASDIEQFSNRPRLPKSVNVHIIRSKERQRSEGFFNANNYKEKLVERCNNRINELTIIPSNLEEEILMENDIKNAIQRLPIAYENNIYQIDYLQLSNYVFEAEKTALNRNDKLMIEALEKYGIIHTLTGTSNAIQNKQDKAKALEYRKEKKVEEGVEFLEEIELLENYKNEIVHFENDFIKRKNTLSKTKRKASERFLILTNLGLTTEEAIKELKKCGLSNVKFQLLVNRWKVWQLKNNKAYMSENTTFGILIKAMIEEFKEVVEEGVAINIETIKSKLINVLSLDKSFDLELLSLDKRNDKTLKIVRYFFDVTGIRFKKDGNRFFVYKVGPVTFSTTISYIGKVSGPSDLMKDNSNALNSIEINSFGYPSFWD
jgi:hypothetical protein